MSISNPVAWFVSAVLLTTWQECAFAQIIPDTTLGSESSTLTPISSTVDSINGGATRGTNLFHSFSQFNINEGRAAYFTNPTGIENILTRVTGSNGSNILGTLGVSGGNANLFLINPNGIIFGENARLDVGGSFMASTASSIQLADGTEFSAVNPSAPPLLTISVPIGLQFYGTEGDIVVRTGQAPAPPASPANPQPPAPPANPFPEVGDAGQLPDTAQTVNSQTSGTSFDGISGTLADNNDVDLYQLFLTEGQAFTATTLGGSEVDTQLFLFDAGGLGVYGNDDTPGVYQSTVPVNQPFTATASGTYYLGISSYNNDPLSPLGEIFKASGQPTSDISGSPLIAWDESGFDSGAYTIAFAAPQVPAASDGGLQVQPGRTLALIGGNVSLDDGQLLAPGGRVELGGVAGEGTVGLSVNGSDLHLSFPVGVPQADVSITNNAQVNVLAGGGGSIAINAQTIEILGDSELVAGISPGLGSVGDQAGDIRLNATGAIEIINSDILNTVQFRAVGNAGKITITAHSIAMADGAYLVSSTSGEGNAGNLSLTVTDTLSLAGLGGDKGFSAIESAVEEGAVGQGGNITVTARSIALDDGAYLVSTTGGEGKAGNITLTVTDSLSLAGVDGNGIGSAIASGVYEAAVGDGGDITITAGSIALDDGAILTSRTRGEGNAGNVNLTVTDSLSLAGLDSDGVGSAIASDVYEGAIGDGGQLTITTDSLSLIDGAQLTATSDGQGEAGNIQVQARSIFLDNHAELSAETASGRGGNITLQGQDLILMRNESAIATTAEQNGNGGNITINSPFVVAIPTENSDIVANAERGSGGQIRIIATGIYGLEFREELTPYSDINASSDFGVDGTVELDTPDVDPNRGLTNLPENLVGSSTLIANSCLARSSGQEDRFVITGAGGLPTRPGDAFTSPFPTGAVRSLPTNRAGSAVAPGSVSLTNPSRPSPSRVAVPINPVSLDSQADHSDASPSSNNSPHPAAFVEATGWVKGPKGEVILTAQAPTITPHSSWSTPPTCHDVVGEFGKPNPSASSGAR